MKKASPQLKSKCLGKVAHSTLSSAEYVLDKMRVVGEVLEIYKCEFCKKYHIGHKPGTRKKGFKKKLHIKNKIKYKLTEE